MQIHLHCVDLDGLQLETGLVRHLGPAEQLRADGFRLARDRRRFIARRWWMRGILGEALNCSAKSLELAELPGRAPRLVSGALAFSLSHAAGIALLAIAPKGPLGCDIEWCDPALDVAALASEVCTPNELAWLHGVPDADRSACFHRLWTRKEAFVKALGVGLTRGWERLDVCEDPSRPLSVGPGCGGWSMVSLVPLQGFAAAVTAPGAWSLRRHGPPKPNAILG